MIGEQLERLATQEWRTRLDLRVHLSKYYRAEAPARAIGHSINLAGDLENLAPLELHTDQPLSGGHFGRDIIQSMSPNLVSLSAANKVRFRKLRRATMDDTYDVILSDQAIPEGSTSDRKLSYVLEQLVHVDDPDRSRPVGRPILADGVVKVRS